MVNLVTGRGVCATDNMAYQEVIKAGVKVHIGYIENLFFSCSVAKRIHKLLSGVACWPCLGLVVMSPATS